LKTNIVINKSTETVIVSNEIPTIICENLIGTPYTPSGQEINVYNNISNKFANFIIPESNAFG
jgi:hypothetical protein